MLRPVQSTNLILITILFSFDVTWILLDWKCLYFTIICILLVRNELNQDNKGFRKPTVSGLRIGNVWSILPNAFSKSV